MSTSPPLPRLRLAPTPSGLLHIGNGANFVLTAALAQALSGELLLRVDDLDGARVRGEYLNDIDVALDFLFPRPLFVGLRQNTVHQSSRIAHYAAALDTLRARDLVYACTCSRRDLRAAQEAAGLRVDVNAYLGTCRDKALPLDAEGAVWRLRTEEPAGDFVVRQRNGRPSYQVASLVDDVALGITHVVRGEDLASSTAMQRVLAKALAPHDEAYAAFTDDPPGVASPVRFYHHPLLTDPRGRKLSKSAGADSLRALRQDGMRAEVVYYEAARLLDPEADCRDLADLTTVVSRTWLQAR